MKSIQLKTLALVLSAVTPCVALAGPASELDCTFQGQRASFKLSEHPNEAVAHVMFEEAEGICGLATAYTDENGTPQLNLHMYESCFGAEVAERIQSNPSGKGPHQLFYVKTTSSKLFEMACMVNF